ncbi:MAG: choice-of-anchor J domain-containing protein, partial [Prevotella sp.]|nr:choice-of-anchor J domain-containing protein [Prevotella sp.]
MKKILVILLCALGLPIAMSAQQQERKAGNMPNVMRTVRTVDGKINAPAKVAMPENVAVNNITDKTAEVTWVGNDGEQFNVRYREYLEFQTFTWDFEAGIEGWTQIDADGDGNMWTHHLNDGSGNYTVNSGVGSIISASFDNNNGSALTPDNWMISPWVELGASVSLWAVAQDPKWADEHFAVYVTTGDPTNTENFVEVIPETVATGVMTQYTGNTSEYAGQMGYVAIRHFNCKDQFYLVVDDVTIIYPREDGRTEPEWTVAVNATSPHAIEGLAPETEYEVQVQTVGNEEWTESVRFTTLEQQAESAVTPIGLTEYEIGDDYAIIGWTGNGETSWNVRYRKSIGNSFWHFEEGADDWTMIDADGDGHSWEFKTDGFISHSGSGTMTSFSYDNEGGSALTPDNWLVSPEVALDGTLTFWAVGQDPSYAAEHFAVYASTGDPTNTASFVEIMPETVATGEMTEYTVDLTAYAGQKGHIAFRHFNVTDMFALNIDDVLIYIGPDYAWTVVEGVTENPYTIEGLESGTDYHFQVQAIGEAGDVSEWSETLTFTTSMPDAIVEVASETTANNVWYNIN